MRTAPIVAAGLLGGYTVARKSGNRPLGGAVLAGCGLLAGRSWAKTAGPAATTGLTAIYLLGFGASHPLAKKIGAWPAVLAATAASAGAAHLVADQRA